MKNRWLRNWIIRYVPTRLVRPAKKVLWQLSGRSPDEGALIPPPTMTFVYGADPEFKALGKEFRKYFIELGGLKPEHKVLDIGCGIGRVGLALLDYLSDQGEYQGFDIIREGIEWCQTHVTPRRPNFVFQTADVYNKMYNPSGRMRATEFRFPYADAYFDFVYTTSVFTHMQPREMEHYLTESIRVMKPGARCMHTFFLLTPESETLMAAGKAMFDFAYQLEGCRTVSRLEPEKAVAYDEEFVRSCYQRHGLRLIEPILYGNWCGRAQFLDGQDIILAEKA